MLQQYIRFCTKKVLEAINIGTMELVNMKRNVFTSEFILLGLLVQEDSSIITIIDQLKMDTEGIKKRLMDAIFNSIDTLVNIPSAGNIQLVISNEVEKVFEIALQESNRMGDKLISTEILFLALLNPQAGNTAEIIKGVGLEPERVKTAIKEIRGGRKVVNQDDESKLDALKEYTADLIELARKGELDPVIGREKEIERVIQILSRRKKNNPVLIGEAGVGKTVIVEGLAQQIAAAEVPQSLLTKRILSLDMAALIAGAGVRGEFEGRLKSIRDSIIDAGGRIILFIDELHTVVGVGGGGGAGGMGAPDILKPALARGQLQLIGATTYDDYHKSIEPDRALARRFQTVTISAPGIEETRNILEGLKLYYERHHKINYTPESIDAATRLSDRYITDRAQPDKAIDLLDEAGSKKHLEMHYTPPDIKKLENEKRAHNALKMEAFERQDFKEATKHHAKLLGIEERLASEKEKWKKELKDKDSSVTAEDIATIVSGWTGIPASRMLETEAEKLSNMEEKIHERIVAQEAAVKAIADAIRRNRAGLREATRPIGAFLFLGPTGVGKTELAKTLAEFLFDDEARIVRLDMSEYMERHEVAKLIGAPPGYIGYGEGGQLTEKIKRVPYAVVLLDEVEKAHPDVFNMLLQVLDEGRLTDAQGHVISFRNTIIIGTSNIGSEKLAEKHEIGFKPGPGIISHDEAKELVLSEVKKYFKPEFLNRLDDMIVFHYLTREHISRILEILLNKLIKRLEGERIYLEICTEIKERLAADGYDPTYGARPLKRTIEKEIENKLSLSIVKRQFQPGDKVRATLQDGEIAFEKI